MVFGWVNSGQVWVRPGRLSKRHNFYPGDFICLSKRQADERKELNS